MPFFNIQKPLFGLLAFGIMFCAAGVANANPSLVVDARTGQVITSEDATLPWHPASTTKLMTTYIALKMLKNGEIKLDTPLQGTRRAASQKPSKIGIKPGQIITLDNALKILLVKSANDLAYVIAENLSGSVEAFVSRMNAEAQTLGMHETFFTNPNGWHDSRQQTSARDLAILARALLIEFPEYHDYWGIGSVRLGNAVYKNTNGLIGRYDGAIGMKTGFVCASGFNVVALAERGGRTLITVVLGSATSSERTVKAAQLFDKGFLSSATGQSLQELPRAGQLSATNIRGQVCGGRRGLPPIDEDYDGAIQANTSQDSGADKDSIYATMRGNTIQANTFARVTNRYALGERVLGEALPVYLGRAPGNLDPVFNQKLGTSVADLPVVTSYPRSKTNKLAKGHRHLAKAALRQKSKIKDANYNLKIAPVGDITQTIPVAIPMQRASVKAGIRTNPNSNQLKKLGAITPKVQEPKINLEPPKPMVTPTKQGLIRPEPVKPKITHKAVSAPKTVTQDE